MQRPPPHAVAFGFGCLLACPLLFLGFPSADLPLHEGMVALLVHKGDPTFAPSAVYALSLGHANQLFYVLAWPLACVIGAGPACRILFASIVVATLAGAAHLARHMGKSHWAAIAMAPVAFGWSLYWGFAPQMLGFALFLWSLPLLDNATARPSPGKTVSACLAVAGLGFAHVASMLCAGIAVSVFALVRPLSRVTAVRLVPAFVGGALALAETLWETENETPLAHAFGSRILWHPIATKLRSVLANLMGAHGIVEQGMLALLLFTAVILWRRRAPEVRTAMRLRERLTEHRMLLLGALCFVVYLSAPYSVNFGAFLYVRFLAVAYALLLVSLAPRKESGGPLVYAPALGLFIAPLLAALPDLAVARAEANAVSPLIAQIEKGSSTAVIHLGKRDESLLFDPTSFGNRVLGERGGRLLFSFAEYPIAPVVVRREMRWDATLARVYSHPSALVPAYDLRRLRFVLVHAIDETLAPKIVRAMAPEGELVDSRGDWMLFRSTLPDAPLAQPDTAPPAESETLQMRVNRQR